MARGPVRSRHGARYNDPGARAVYLADTPPACFAERMFYFHLEALAGIDRLHLAAVPIVPPFQQRFVLWDVTLKAPVGPGPASGSMANAVKRAESG